MPVEWREYRCLRNDSCNSQCALAARPSAIETQLFACRWRTVHGSWSHRQGRGRQDYVASESRDVPEKWAKTELTRNSSGGYIVSSCFCPAARSRRSDGAKRLIRAGGQKQNCTKPPGMNRPTRAPSMRIECGCCLRGKRETCNKMIRRGAGATGLGRSMS